MLFRNTLLVALIVCLFVFAAPAPAASKWGPERLDAPVWDSITEDSTSLTFEWSDVYTDPPTNTLLAPKYSLDIEAEVTYTPTGGDPVSVRVSVELSFGTSDRTDSGAAADSDLTITKDELRAAVLAALGLTEDDVEGKIDVEGSAKVKALDPGKGKGPQNNPFSDSDDPDAAFSVELPDPT